MNFWLLLEWGLLPDIFIQWSTWTSLASLHALHCGNNPTDPMLTISLSSRRQIKIRFSEVSWSLIHHCSSSFPSFHFVDLLRRTNSSPVASLTEEKSSSFAAVTAAVDSFVDLFPLPLPPSPDLLPFSWQALHHSSCLEILSTLTFPLPTC